MTGPAGYRFDSGGTGGLAASPYQRRKGAQFDGPRTTPLQ